MSEAEQLGPWDVYDGEAEWRRGGFSIATKSGDRFRKRVKGMWMMFSTTFFILWKELLDSDWLGWSVRALLASLVAMTVWMWLRKNRHTRITGDTFGFAKSQEFARIRWAKESFAWGSVRGFEVAPIKDTGCWDVEVLGGDAPRRLGMFLSSEDADRLILQLEEMRIAAKRESASQGGYRGGVRVSDGEDEVVAAEVESAAELTKE